MQMMTSREISILLVEDDEVDQINVKRAFKKNRVSNSLFIAQNGIEALNMLRSGEISLNPNPIVLLDINMPKMGGIEFLREIRNDEKLRSLTVFILTTSNDDRDKLAAYDLNVAGYILKPVLFEDFVRSVKTLGDYWGIVERI